MLTTFSLLLISFSVANSMHFYLLYRQRHNRKSTISYHAAKSRRTHTWYIAGHIVASTTFYVFARRFFISTPQSEILMTIAAIGWIADIIQAIIPAKGKAEKYHEIFAYVMAVSVILMGLLAAFTIPQPQIAELASRTLALCLALSIPISLIVKRKYFYRVQMISLLVFYVEMFIIVLRKT